MPMSAPRSSSAFRVCAPAGSDSRARLPVESLDVVEPTGEHDRGLVTTCGQPLFDHPASCVSTSRGDGHAPAVEVLVDDRIGLTATQAGESSALPRIALTAVLDQTDVLEPSGQPHERASSLDLRELARVADQHDLRSLNRPGLSAASAGRPVHAAQLGVGR